MPSRELVIGDIHGCLTHFDAMLEGISLMPDDRLVLLGDYVDRGPDSAGVLKRVIKLAGQCHLTALRGNHEEMMLAARDSLSIHAASLNSRDRMH